MNEEERIIRSIKYIINQNYVDTEDDIIGILIKALNLIKKQSKEIEELKDFITKLQATKDRLDSYDKENTLEIEKLKKEIEELKDKNKTLKNLQNDTNRIYIEMIERKNYFEGKLQKLEDKIKAKIKELEKEIITGAKKTDIIRRAIIYELQSLLEKE